MTAVLDLHAEPQLAVSLRNVVDDLCARLDGWVVVDRRGEVLEHAPGPAPCPEAMACAIVARDTAELQQAWSRRAQSGSDLPFYAAGAGDGLTVWTTGAPAGSEDLHVIGLAADAVLAVRDPEFAMLLEGVGPRPVGAAPAATLVALRAERCVGILARHAGRSPEPSVRVHAQHPWVYLAARPQDDVAVVLTRLLDAVGAPVHAGIAEVPVNATDWRSTGQLARRCAHIARAEGLPWVTTASALAVQKLVLDVAATATHSLIVEAGLSPLERLRAYDRRSGGCLEETVRAWLQRGCDPHGAAADLHVHTNTLRYRLRRAAAESGFDLQDSEARLAMWLLLRAGEDGRR